MMATLIAPVASFFLEKTFLLVGLGILTLAFVTFDLVRLKSVRANQWFAFLFYPLLRDYENVRITGASYILIASLLVFLIFPRDIAALSLIFLAVGDPASAIARVLATRSRSRVALGAVACFLACAAAGFVAFYAGLAVSLPAALAGAVVATAVETLHLPLNDNFTMPLLAGMAMLVAQI
jgi:dolichol kinase